jgi:hypothetical protein
LGINEDLFKVVAERLRLKGQLAVGEGRGEGRNCSKMIFLLGSEVNILQNHEAVLVLEAWPL